MRILVVGAGAVGGYFGGRLLAARRDVTFLVRPARAAQLAATGLVIQSRTGDVTVPTPPTVLATDRTGPFDLVLLSCKAYDLDAAVDAVAPFVGPTTRIVPLLNGMRHLDVLDARFGRQRVLGGQCVIAATLGPNGEIVHLNDRHAITFGDRGGASVSGVEAALTGAGFDAKASGAIELEMWEKWVFLATLAGLTCSMRGTVGDVIAADGLGLARDLLDECTAIAVANGFAPRAAALERSSEFLSTPGSPLTASMARDMERGARTEADHILGDLIRRAPPRECSPLRIAYQHLRVYEVRRAR